MTFATYSRNATAFYPLLLALTVACGPVPGGSEGGSSGDMTTESTTTSDSAGPTTVVPTTSSTDPSGSDSDSEPTTDPTTTDPTTTESTTDTPFVPGPDVGLPVNCSVTEQDCPPEKKCVPWADDGGDAPTGTRCVDIPEHPAQAGEPCMSGDYPYDGIDNCEIGTMCWFLDEQGLGTCQEMCSGDPPSCPEQTVCNISHDGAVALCLSACDPLAPSCNHPEDVCIPGSEGGFVCNDASLNGAHAGSPCKFSNSCTPGNFCGDEPLVPNCMDSYSCCAPFCDLEDPNPNQACLDAYADAMHDLGGGEVECVPWFDPGDELPGLEHVGACVSTP